ncbi:MAG: type II toxin-antitoxin system VapC family toxin [Pseudomonadota bacterium]|nr:type II toxin-antitoxin system VapC family toxin [Pseudomonadota bacterium]
MVGKVAASARTFRSVIVLEEASRGDEIAAKLRLEKIEAFPVLEITDEVRELADIFFERIPIPQKARGDAYHLALATFHGMDFLVSWNFSHILNARVRATVQSINLSRGISTPEELMEV